MAYILTARTDFFRILLDANIILQPENDYTCVECLLSMAMLWQSFSIRDCH
jgi:hypothetical protein